MSGRIPRTIRCRSLPVAGPSHKEIAAIATDVDAAVATAQTEQPVSLRDWDLGQGKLQQLVAYGRKVYGLRSALGGVCDGRRQPSAEAPQIAAAIFFTGLLRIRSLNALEPKLKEKTFLSLVGAGTDGKALCSADTVSRALKVMDLDSLRSLTRHIVAKAERNKVFREGWHGALRFVAIDGWEPISSFDRHCAGCLTRRVKVKRDGEDAYVEQYYHRYVVAMLIDKRFDIVLDIEPLLPHDLRPEPTEDQEHEGELTAAKRLLARVKETFGWLDVVVGDALYANGPFLTLVDSLKMGAVIIAKKETDEPLKEALNIWGSSPPQEVFEDAETKERIELWDCPDLETLDTYKGSIRVVRGRVTSTEGESESDKKKPNEKTKRSTAGTDEPKKPKKPSTWCMLVIGQAAKLSSRKVLAVARARWHIENTGFHQWTTRWYFEHVFVHDQHGMQALYWLFFAAFNLLTLFLYQQLRCYGRDRGRDVTRTISRLIDEMNDDLARLVHSPWNTS